MKLDQAMESSQWSQKKEGENVHQQKNNVSYEVSKNGADTRIHLESVTSTSVQSMGERLMKNPEYSRWDRLLYIDLKFYVNDLLIQEELLWERNNNEVKTIKQFCFNFIAEKIFKTSKDNKFELKEGANQITIDFLILCSEFMTRKISEEIRFFETVRPFKKLKEGVFGSGSGINDEHLIKINLDLKYGGYNYQDEFEWDLINEYNIPEVFAEQIVNDLSLPHIFIKLISMSIRKQIKTYVFDLVENFTRNFENIKLEYMIRKKAPSEDILKKFGLSDSILNLESLSTSTSLRKRNTSVSSNSNYLHVKPQLFQPLQVFQLPQKNNFTTNKPSTPLFATYSNSQITHQATTNEIQLPSKVFKSYYENIILNDPLVRLDDKLNKPLTFLFDNKLEKILGKKSHRSRLSNEIILPEFLKNKIPLQKIESEIEEKVVSCYSSQYPTPIKNHNKNNTVLRKNSSNIKSSRKTSSENISATQVTKEKIMIMKPIRIPLTDSAIKSRKNTKIIQDISVKNSIIVIDKPNFRKEIIPEIEGEPNPHVISFSSGGITINKEILKYSEYYEKIVIDKSIFKNFEQDFLTQNFNFYKENENHQVNIFSTNEDNLKVTVNLKSENKEENKVEYSGLENGFVIDETLIKDHIKFDVDIKQENYEEMEKLIDFKLEDFKQSPLTNQILDEIKQELKTEDFLYDDNNDKKTFSPIKFL